MSDTRLSPQGLLRIARNLSERDLAIIRHIGELRLMNVGQIEALSFPSDAHASELSARRVARRVLERLTRDRLLTRLERRIGGIYSGSSGYIYALGPVGVRVLSAEGQRRHFREPSTAFIDHTLAIAQVAVNLRVAARRGNFEVEELQTEPRCWRRFGGVGTQSLLSPDLFVSLGIAELEHRWFIEVDLGTEHVPTLVRKCQLYIRYYQTGIEQRRHGVFPRVCWVLPSERRAEQLGRALKSSGNRIEGLFVLTMAERVLGDLVGGQT